MSRRIVIAGTQRAAEDKCRELGWPPPPHRVNGERTYVFTVTQPDRLRGFLVRPDDNVRRGYFEPHLNPTLYDEFNFSWAMSCRDAPEHR